MAIKAKGGPKGRMGGKTRTKQAAVVENDSDHEEDQDVILNDNGNLNSDQLQLTHEQKEEQHIRTLTGNNP